MPSRSFESNTLCREEHPEKVLNGSVFRLPGTTADLSAEHLEKTPFPRLFKLLGSVTDSSLDSEKAVFPIFVRLLGRETTIRFVSYLNASSPISVTPSGTVTLVRDGLSEKSL
jgi:hypothetical protein